MNSSIFYADDDLDDLDIFKEVTCEINETVTLFDRGDKMLDILHNPPPNAALIFLDLNMPVKSGFEVLTEIKSTPELTNIPVVILTTSTNTADIQLSKKLGANLYISKPATFFALKKAINYALQIDWENFIPSDKEYFYKFT